jgi:hypothetical protein
MKVLKHTIIAIFFIALLSVPAIAEVPETKTERELISIFFPLLNKNADMSDLKGFSEEKINRYFENPRVRINSKNKELTEEQVTNDLTIIRRQLVNNYKYRHLGARVMRRGATHAASSHSHATASPVGGTSGASTVATVADK